MCYWLTTYHKPCGHNHDTLERCKVYMENKKCTISLSEKSAWTDLRNRCPLCLKKEQQYGGSESMGEDAIW
jgi:hypothetical protein